jgi:hypothetical protein
MRLIEIQSLPKLIKLHYFNVDDQQASKELGMKQDRNGRWYLPQYNSSGRIFNQKFSSAVTIFGRPINSIEIN